MRGTFGAPILVKRGERSAVFAVSTRDGRFSSHKRDVGVHLDLSHHSVVPPLPRGEGMEWCVCRPNSHLIDVCERGFYAIDCTKKALDIVHN